jgi:hypothetical protein
MKLNALASPHATIEKIKHAMDPITQIGVVTNDLRLLDSAVIRSNSMILAECRGLARRGKARI